MYRVLTFTVKPRASADSRYRMLQYIPFAERDGIQIDHRSLMTDRYFEWQMENSHLLLRILLLPYLLLKRLWEVLIEAPGYDVVWISREMAPIGPPLFEWLLVWRCRRIVLDMDDALHIVDKKGSRWISRVLRDHGKFSRMARHYSVVVCGNHFLAEFYRSHRANVAIVPTVVDADAYDAVHQTPSDMLRIGWIGTPLNRHHVAMIGSAMEELARERNFELVLVGIQEPFDWNVPTHYVRWTLEEEMGFFAGFDIGVMPLKDSQFARGKCAFKIIQYMAAGLPLVASPVGANADVVTQGEDGFLASTDEEWLVFLRRLMDDETLRHTMGRKGREAVRARYSVQSAWPQYRSILTGKDGETN